MAISLMVGGATSGGDGFTYIEPSMIYVLAPLIIGWCTLKGRPVSTSFLTLTIFAPAFVVGKMVVKSANGYVYGLVTCFLIWSLLLFAPYWFRRVIVRTRRHNHKRKLRTPHLKRIERWLRWVALEKRKTLPREQVPYWATAQLCSTLYLWAAWLGQDLANAFVFFSRPVPLGWMLTTLTVLNVGLVWLFYKGGGPIQESVAREEVHDLRTAVVVDLTFGTFLWYFQEVSNVPMSTTWVFFGLLAGRGIAIGLFRKFVRIKPKKHPTPFKTRWHYVIENLGGMMIGAGYSILGAIVIRGVAQSDQPFGEYVADWLVVLVDGALAGTLATREQLVSVLQYLVINIEMLL